MKPPQEKDKEKEVPPPAVAQEAPPPAPQTGPTTLRRSQPLPMWGDQEGPSPGPPVAVLVAGGGAAPAGGAAAVPVKAALPVPSLRGFKIADHESPAPLDRAYIAFNFYDNVDASTDRALGSDVRDQRIYRETFGLEKTFFDERASVGLRLPVNTLTGDSDVPGLGGSNTAVGDLSVILKYAAWRDRESGNLVSVGLAVTAPTGPNSFAGSPAVAPLHSTTLQPYVGYLWNRGDFYLHGFTSIDVPTDLRDVTLLYDDVGIGYHLYRARDPGRWLSGVVPTFEVHVNTPLDHRGSLLRDGPPQARARLPQDLAGQAGPQRQVERKPRVPRRPAQEQLGQQADLFLQAAALQQQAEDFARAPQVAVVAGHLAEPRASACCKSRARRWSASASRGRPVSSRRMPRSR